MILSLLDFSRTRVAGDSAVRPQTESPKNLPSVFRRAHSRKITLPDIVVVLSRATIVSKDLPFVLLLTAKDRDDKKTTNLKRFLNMRYLRDIVGSATGFRQVWSLFRRTKISGKVFLVKPSAF